MVARISRLYKLPWHLYLAGSASRMYNCAITITRYGAKVRKAGLVSTALGTSRLLTKCERLACRSHLYHTSTAIFAPPMGVIIPPNDLLP